MSARRLQFTAVYFDGRSPRRHEVALSLTPRHLTITLAEGLTRDWKHTDLRLRAPSGSGKPPFHLEHTENEIDADCLETLAVDDPAFLESLRSVTAVSLHPTLRPKSGLKGVLMAVAVLAVPFFLYGVWSQAIPKLTERLAMQVPIAWEEKLGDSILDNLPPTLRPSPQPEQEEALNAIARRLLSTSPNQPYKIRVHISPHPLVNAVALPGGPVLVFQGLLNLAETPEELAGVVAHEIQHVLLRHSTRGILRGMASSILLTLISGDVNGSMSAVLEVAGGLEGLAHSRKMERQADRKAMDMILSANIDPQGMIRMFEKLQSQEQTLIPESKAEDSGDGSPAWTEYLSTHPAGKERVREMKKQVAMAGKKSYTPLLPHLDWKSLIHKQVNPKQSEDNPPLRET
jgi:predicted Zn-dependent protease